MSVSCICPVFARRDSYDQRRTSRFGLGVRKTVLVFRVILESGGRPTGVCKWREREVVKQCNGTVPAAFPHLSFMNSVPGNPATPGFKGGIAESVCRGARGVH